MTTNIQSDEEPALRGVPSYFRSSIAEASRRAILGLSSDGKAIRADYSVPGWNRAIHLEDYLDDDAIGLEQIASADDAMRGRAQSRTRYGSAIPGTFG